MLEVNSLFEFDLGDINLEEYKGKNILFIQKNKTAEIFDFGILINQNNQLIMKLYQITTKKSQSDLDKLDVDIIKLHCVNISKQLEKLGKIIKFSFGIITSYKCYKNKDVVYNLMKKDCQKKNFELIIYNIIEKIFYIENDKDKKLLPLENIYSINDINVLSLPNYDSFFSWNPRLITMKNLNENYIHCLQKYLGVSPISKDVKIIGKIDYDKSFITESLNDSDLGLLISGYTNEELDEEANLLQEKEKPPIMIKDDLEYKIIKYKGKNEIYAKNPRDNSIKEINELIKGLTKPHIIAFKYNENKFLNKKRHPDNLFSDKIICFKKKK